MRTLPFLGKGIAFPFRINPATGSVETSVGGYDDLSVAIQYINERWTIREDLDIVVNHIAESICHILLTRPLEHDTLPEFGSQLFTILFEPNSELFRAEAAHYFSWSTIRWEKRARIPEQGGTSWIFDGYLADQGIAPLRLSVKFIVQQELGNLVAPFVTTRQARLQEYPCDVLDLLGHDYQSRYYNTERQERGGIQYIRIPRLSPILPAPDDQFYRIKHGDTWLLISWELYHDIRYWPIIARIASEDTAGDGGTRDQMDNCGDPVPFIWLRVPSRRRLLMELGIR